MNRCRKRAFLLTLAALVAACHAGAVAAAEAPSRRTNERRPAQTLDKQGGQSSLTAAKVPEEGQSAMNWPGLNMAGQMQGVATSAAEDLVWRPLTAPGMKAGVASPARTECYLPDGWTFVPLSLADAHPERPQAVQLPHRWSDNRDHVAGWYLRHVSLMPKAGQRLMVRCEQVALFCVLYVNGIECGRHLGAYTPFEFDITAAAKAGDNLLALYVHDASGAVGKGKLYNQVGDWKPQENKPYPGGIWGPVAIERRPEIYLDDVFVKTSTRRHDLTLVCQLHNAGTNRQVATLEFSVLHWPDGAPVALQIPSQAVTLPAGAVTPVTVTAAWPDPQLWSPEHPSLYVLRSQLSTTTAADATNKNIDKLDTRFGFREFWTEGQQFMLNGAILRLRGESHYGAGRFDASADPLTGRELNRKAFLALKERYRANAFRIHAQILSRNVALGADEAGCLLVNQSSIWSTNASRYRSGGEAFLENTRREFGEWVCRDRNCPSVVIWDVENEQMRMREIHKPWSMRLDDFVRAHDDTRPIEHSGAGWYDPSMQIIHLHDEQQYTDIMERWRAGGDRPLVMGEFWIGFQGGENCLTSSREFRSRAENTFEEARLYEEELLQMRNFGISGIMPFQISRVVPPLETEAGPSPGAKAFRLQHYGDKAVACAAAVHHGLQPLTIFFWPRVVSAEAGKELQREVVVCNDAETPQSLTAQWSLADDSPRQAQFTLPPGAQRRIPVSFVAPAHDCRLVARLLVADKLVAAEELPLRIVATQRLTAPELKRQVVVYEGQHPGAVEKLRQLEVSAVTSREVPGNSNETLWVIAPGASDSALSGQRRGIRRYLETGGRVLCLTQEQWPRWSPVRLGFTSVLRETPWYYTSFGVPPATKESLYSCYAPIYAAGHPVFTGISGDDLRFWSPRDGRVLADTLARPSSAGNSSAGAWRVLAGACRPALASLVEARVGRGTLVFCQAQVLEQSHTPEARLLLMNLLRYLDGPGWTADSQHVGMAGAFTAASAAKLTGAAADALQNASPARGDVLIATDGAAVAELEQWADAGGTVLVLSAEVAQRLPGYAVSNKEGFVYVGVRGSDNRLLWGISMPSFLGLEHPCIEGVLTKTPASATVLLHGLSAKATAVKSGKSEKGNQQLDMFDSAGGAVAVATPHGKGTWIVTTMAPWRGQTLHDAELMRTLLANAGMVLPLADDEVVSAAVLKTAPLTIDGRLDDWTSDVEDRNVSPYLHARPILISSENAAEGPVQSDAVLSAISYFLHNDRALYLAGAVFGEGGKATIHVRLDDHLLEIVPGNESASVTIDGKASATVRAAFGHVTSAELTDSRGLSFATVEPRSGALTHAAAVPGITFEMELPWDALGYSKPPAQLGCLIRVERPGAAAIQSPVDAKSTNPDTWLKLKLEP